MTIKVDRRLDTILRVPQVRERTGLSRTTIYRLEAAGKFPKRLRLGKMMTGWYKSDVESWIADPVGYRVG